MIDTQTFGVWLRRWRKHRDLTQYQLAEQVGCAVGTLRNIETDDARPSRPLVLRLISALAIPAADTEAVMALARNGPLQPPPPEPPTPVLASNPAPAKTVSNLPVQLTQLVGRAAECAAVAALVVRPDVRLVTLTGPGGTGKTRLAMQVASDLAELFADGVLFVDLSALEDAAMVLPAIAQAASLPETGSEPLDVQLAAALAEKHMLLLLDNFEQVSSAAAAVAGLLAACPRLSILITSRVGLGLSLGHEWLVAPLALPEHTQVLSVEAALQYAAVRLFYERAQAVNPRFVLNTENLPAILAICQRLDGLPLGIELAAVRTKLFSPPALLARLESSLSFLVGSARDKPTRQHTIRNTIDWSYQLLAPAEQQVFRQFAVFANGAAIEAIAFVCQSDTALQVEQSAAALINNSLLRRLPSNQPRFGMLETIREYALEQFARDPQAATLRARHAQYFTEFAEFVVAHWDGPQATTLVSRLDHELDNMRAALQWARDGGDLVLGLRLAAALRRFWQWRGLYSEGRRWIDMLLAQPFDEHDTRIQRACMHAIHTAAWLASDQHDYVRARSLFEQSVVLRHALGESDHEERLLAPAARQARAVGDYRRATALLEDALARQRAANDRGSASAGGIGQTYYDLALVLREQGFFERAAALVQRGIAFHQSLGEREGIAIGLLVTGDLARDLGHSAELRRAATESLGICRELGVQWAIGFCLNNLAQAALLEGDLRQAETLVLESLAVFRSFDGRASIAEVQITLGEICYAQGELTRAATLLAESSAFAQASGPQLIAVRALEVQALVLLAQGATEPATRMLAAAQEQRRRMGTPPCPKDQAALAAALAQARAALGEHLFPRIWAEAQQPLERWVS